MFCPIINSIIAFLCPVPICDPNFCRNLSYHIIHSLDNLSWENVQLCALTMSLDNVHVSYVCPGRLDTSASSWGSLSQLCVGPGLEFLLSTPDNFLRWFRFHSSLPGNFSHVIKTTVWVIDTQGSTTNSSRVFDHHV